MARADILLPYWGEFSLFKKTVDSIIAQTETNWHLLIADDCYPSKEAEMYISSLNDRRITYHRHKQNIGITRNFNYCIENARAEFCVILGCDDKLLPHYLERALAYIKEADFYQPNVEIIDALDNKYLPAVDRVKRFLRPRHDGMYFGEKLATSLSHGQWLYFPSITWRTSTLKNYHFDDEYTVVEDVVLIMSMILDNKVLYLDNEITFQYRRFANSVSSKEKKTGGVRFKEEDDIYRMLANKFKQRGWKRAFRAAQLHITSRIHRIVS